MKYDRQFFNVAVGVLLLGGALFCLWLVTTISSPTPRETGIIGVLLAALSILGSWVISHVYSTSRSRESAQEKIDTIAQQSSEKILNLSSQLWRLEQYFKASLERVSEDDSETVAAALRNRFDSACYMARMLRSLNNTFLSDWQGVVSESVNIAISKQANSVKDIIEAYDEMDTPPTGDEEKEISVRKELIEKIERLRAQLPSAVTLDRSYRAAPQPPAVSVVQVPDEWTTDRQTGRLEIQLLRAIPFATGSGKFSPRLLHAENEHGK